MANEPKERKRRHNHIKVYLDIILLEAANIHQTSEVSWSSYLIGASNQSLRCPNSFCKVSVGNQYYNSRIVQNDSFPVWNEDCTFVLNRESEEDGTFLNLEVFDKTEKLFYTGENLLGKISISLSAVPFDEIQDLTLFIEPIAPSLKEKALFDPFSLHILVFKSSKKTNSPLLSHFGLPVGSLPIRLDAGDIILVSSSYFLTHGVKLTTWSKWDHVGMVVRFPKKKRLFFLEATTDGVNCYPFSEFVRNTSSDVVGFRRLKLERTKEMISKLSTFVKEHEGKPYKTNIWDLMKAGFGSHETNDSKSFFCSELVAACLQKMGILSETICPSNILPTHFATQQIDSSCPSVKILPVLVFPSREAIRKKEGGPIDESLETPRSREKIISVNVVLTSTEVDQNGSKFTSYTIEVVTKQDSYLIQKRYSQFRFLDGEIKKRFTGTPFLPPKTVGGKLSPVVVRTRQKALQIFLELLLADRLTRKSKPVIEFLERPGASPIAPSSPSFPPVIRLNASVRRNRSLTETPLFQLDTDHKLVILDDDGDDENHAAGQKKLADPAAVGKKKRKARNSSGAILSSYQPLDRKPCEIQFDSSGAIDPISLTLDDEASASYSTMQTEDDAVRKVSMDKDEAKIQAVPS